MPRRNIKHSEIGSKAIVAWAQNQSLRTRVVYPAQK